MYLATARDKDGNIFEAGKIYQLTIPEEAFYNKSFQLADVDRVR